MNKKEILDKIKSLEGLNNDEKAFLINLVNTKKKYGLVWEDKPEDVEEELRTKLPVLKEVKERAIINDTETEHYPNHILIEGDNLHALTALTFTHEGAIDVIYIDPPYNTGQEKEFRYNDKWILKEDPFKHSTWLSFISKRLNIAKRLLNEKGIIIIHIDENEFDALNVLLETDIFSDESFLGAVIWNKQNPKGDAKGVANMHEYLLIYAKNKAEFTTLENALKRPKPNAIKILNKAKRLYAKIGKIDIPEEIKEVIKPFNFPKETLEDFKVKYDLELINKEFKAWVNRQDFSGGEKAYKMIDEHGNVYRGVSMSWPNKEKAPDDYFVPLVHPITNNECPIPSRGWRNPSSTMKKLLENDLILFGEDETKQPERKYLLKDNMFENTPSLYNNGSSDDELFKDLGINFPYPKPVEVAAYFLKSIHPEPKVILDFFAGSGTTLHAAMQLNSKDDGFRQCILVTNNENNICEEVTYERNKRVISGYTTRKGEIVGGLRKNNLRYYQCDFVERESSLANKRQLTLLATELLCIKEDCYKEITSEIASVNWHKLFTGANGNYVYVIYDDGFIEDAVELLKAFITQKPEAQIKVYVFSNGQYAYAEEFEDVAKNIRLAALPDAIYKAYQYILPKQNKEFIPELEEETPVEFDNGIEA